MTKARVPRTRHILFETDGKFTEDEVKKGINSAALRYFGEYGVSFLNLKLIEYDEKTKTGILQCDRSKVDEVLGFLALVTELNGKKARVISKRTSGTINKLKEKAKGRPS